MKVRIWSYTVNAGDGSAYPIFFKTQEEAERYSEEELEIYGEGWSEDGVACHDLEFDQEGTFLNPNPGHTPEDFE